MLRNLQIRNFAIIDEVEVEFDRGMTVLTGETGAGKSILVDALGLVLGERGGNGLVRSGAKRAEFSAEFSLSDLPDAKDWLDQQTLDQDDECVVRRVINEDGRSRAFINGSPVSLQTLKTLGEQLLDIHGQHFHQSLGRRNVQRDLLDHFASLAGERRQTAQRFEDWRSLVGQLEELQALDADRASRTDLLEFQLGELDALDLQRDETDSLRAERQRLQNSGRLADGVSGVLQSIYDSDTTTAQGILAEACHTLEDLSTLDSRLEPVLAIVREAGIQVGEAADMLRRYAEGIDMDPHRRDWVEERLDAIRTVARKHRVDPEALPEVHARIRQTLTDLLNAEERGQEFADRARAAADAYYESAAILSDARKTAAERFSTSVTETMQGLGMPGGVFEVSITDAGEGNERSHGIDVIEFRISANPGQPPMPLAKVASGGELSRMSLAIQVIASDGNPIPTMIFDEVDSGIGGGVAEMLGRRLKQVGDHCQVLSVTHLPQVASVADHHCRINKISDGNTTRTGVARLNTDERIEELARMLGGVSITAKTREHAAEMLAAGLQTDKGRRQESA
jgi:DNA repair protein RecN (Recombination protein N)